MTDRELMQQALEALESMKTYAESAEPGLTVGVPIITALRERLEQPEDYEALWKQMCEQCDELDAKLAEYEKAAQEPVAWIEHGLIEAPDGLVWERGSVGRYTALYTTPPRRGWVGLTEEDVSAILENYAYPRNIIKAAEAKLKEKNT